MNVDQFGQGIVGLIIIIGVVVQRLEARRTAKKVASKVEEAATTTEKQLQEIHIMVDGRLDEALKKIHGLEARLDTARGDAPGTAAQEAGPPVLQVPHTTIEDR